MRPGCILALSLLLMAIAAVVIIRWIHSEPETQIPIRAFYQCGREYRPFDIAFAADGTLFSSDGPGNALYEHAPGCRQIVGIGTVPGNRFLNVGVTVDNRNRVCFAVLTYFTPYAVMQIRPSGAQANRPRIWCWTTTPAMHLHPNLEADWLRGHYAFGMASFQGRSFLALWDSSRHPVDGFIIAAARRRIVNEIALGPWAPQFMHPISRNELFVTALTGVSPSNDPYDVIHPAEGGAVLHVRNSDVTVIAADLQYPTGIVATDNHLYVADYLTGEIHVYTHSGDRLNSIDGFGGPMGMAQAPNGDICVAEMDGGQIRCMPPDRLLADEP